MTSVCNVTSTEFIINIEISFIEIWKFKSYNQFVNNLVAKRIPLNFRNKLELYKKKTG